MGSVVHQTPAEARVFRKPIARKPSIPQPPAPVKKAFTPPVLAAVVEQLKNMLHQESAVIEKLNAQLRRHYEYEYDHHRRDCCATESEASIVHTV